MHRIFIALMIILFCSVLFIQQTFTEEIDSQPEHNDQTLLKKNYPLFVIIIFFIIIAFAFINYRQWCQVKRTNLKLESTIRELNAANYKLEQIARTDPLTLISNRRDLIEKINQEQMRFERNGKPFVIIIADIDNFKLVNDEYGHDAGDFILQSVAQLIRSSLRTQDVVGRWGGEEFLLILPETDLRGGRKLAEKLRKTIETTPFVYGKNLLHITITSGVSVYNVPQEIKKIIKRSDEAMYEGKNKGKNCVILAKNGVIQSNK